MARDTGARSWEAACDQITGNLSKASTLAMGDTGQYGAGMWKSAVQGGFERPGKLINTIKVNIYPKGRTSIEPAAWIYSKAGAIMQAYAQGVVIRAKQGKFLAIPTPEVPKKRQGQAMSPREVQAKFGKALVFIAAGGRHGLTTSSIKHGAAYLVVKDLVLRQTTGRYRNASTRELGARLPRATDMVVMFILVPWTIARKRFDLVIIADQSGSAFVGFFDRRFQEVSR